MRFITGFAALAFVPGCHAQVRADVNASGDVQGSGEAAPPSESAQPAPAATNTQPESPTATPGAPTAEPALLGARSDLSFRGSSPTCLCLAAKAGPPGAFQWAGAVPSIDPGSQIVVGLSSAGIPCREAGKDARPASYWGYTVSGGDVIVTVENAVPGRPVVSGAIIPRPQGGHVVLVPADDSVVYGRPLTGAGDRCALP